MDEPAFAKDPRPDALRDRIQLAVCGVVLVGLMYSVCYVLEMFKSDILRPATEFESVPAHARP